MQKPDLTHVIRIAQKKARERGVVYGPEEWERLVGRTIDKAETSAGASFSFDASLLAKSNPRKATRSVSEVLDEILAMHPSVTGNQAKTLMKKHCRCRHSDSEFYTLTVEQYAKKEDIPPGAETREYKWRAFDSALSSRRKKLSVQQA